MSTSTLPLRRSSPRVEGDPDKYIRFVKGRYQARPYDQGVRYNLGLFPTVHAARKARDEFWWGRVKERLRFARPYPQRPGLWIAVVWVPARGGDRRERVRVGDAHPTAEAAQAAAVAWLRAEMGPLVAAAMLAAAGDERPGALERWRQREARRVVA